MAGPGIGRTKYLILAVLAIAFLIRTDSITVQTTAPLVVRIIYGIPVADVGIASIIFAVANLVSRYLFATRVTVVSISRAISAGVGIMLLSLVAVYVTNDLTAFLLATVVTGFGYGLVASLVVSQINLLSDRKELETNLSLYTVSLSAGLVVSPLSGEPVIAYFGLKSVYLFLAGLAFIALVSAVVIQCKSGIKEQTPRSTADAEFGVAENLRVLSKSKSYLSSLLSMVAFSLSFGLFTSYGGIYAQQRFGFSSARVQVIFLLYFGVSLTSRIALTSYSKLNRSLDTELWLRVGLWLNVVALMFIGFGHGMPLFFVGLVFLAIPHAIIAPLCFIRIAYSVDRPQLIVANTIFLSLLDVGGVVGPMAAVFLIPYLHIRGIWPLYSVMPLVAIWNLNNEVKRRRKGRTSGG